MRNKETGNDSMTQHQKRVLSWGITFLWMALIFYLSSQPATESRELSRGIAVRVAEILDRLVPQADIDFRSLHGMLRKQAHFWAYLVLGPLVLNALKQSGVKGRRAVVLGLAISVVYAITDEIHQTFVPGRSGEVFDVVIDTAGAATGMALYGLMGWIRRKKRLE